MNAQQTSQASMARSSSAKVTIGMPVYNGAERIGQALSCLAHQSYADFRLIVSDNASSDDTWAILQKWAAQDSRIALHRQPANIGAIRNFRYLLDQAETEYFMWHAFDDHIAPNYLEELVGVMTEDAQCSLACGVGVHEDPDGSPIRRVEAPQTASKSRLARIRNLLEFPEITWTYGLFRTELLREARVIAEDFGYTWAADQLTVLPFILNDGIRGCSNTAFFWCRTNRSSEHYRPDTAAAKVRFAIRYLRFHFRAARASSLSLREELLCLPWLLKHANRTLESFFQRPLRKYVRNTAKRLVKTVRTGP